MLIPAAFALPVGLIIYGWTAQYHIHWIVPIFGTFFIGVGFSGSMVRLDVSSFPPLFCDVHTNTYFLSRLASRHTWSELLLPTLLVHSPRTTSYAA
jgi:hypothetical protein